MQLCFTPSLRRSRHLNQPTRVLEFLISITCRQSFDLYSKDGIPAALKRSCFSNSPWGSERGLGVLSDCWSPCKPVVNRFKERKTEWRNERLTSGNFKAQTCPLGWRKLFVSLVLMGKGGRTGVSGPITVRCRGKRELQGWPKSLDSTYTHTPIVPTFPQLQIEV